MDGAVSANELPEASAPVSVGDDGEGLVTSPDARDARASGTSAGAHRGDGDEGGQGIRKSVSLTALSSLTGGADGDAGALPPLHRTLRRTQSFHSLVSQHSSPAARGSGPAASAATAGDAGEGDALAPAPVTGPDPGRQHSPGPAAGTAAPSGTSPTADDRRTALPLLHLRRRVGDARKRAGAGVSSGGTHVDVDTAEGLGSINDTQWAQAQSDGGPPASGVLVTFAQALSNEVEGVLHQAARASEPQDRDELLADLYANVTHEVEPNVAEQIAPAAYRFYFEMLGDYYERYPAAVASMTVMWTALWSHDLFAPIFCLLFAKWLLRTSHVQAGHAGHSSSGGTSVTPGVYTPHHTRTLASPSRAGSPQRRLVGSPSSPGSPSGTDADEARFALAGPLSPPVRGHASTFTPRRESSTSAHTSAVSGSHYVALVAGAARVFSFDVHRHTRRFESLYHVVKQFIADGPGTGVVDAAALRPHVIMRDLAFRFFTYYDEPDALRALLQNLAPIDASLLAGSDAPQLPTDPAGILAYNAHDFVASATKDVFRVSNEASLLKMLGGFRGLVGVPLDIASSNSVHNTLYALTRPGGPRFPTRPVRHAARSVVDAVFPNGRLIRRLLHLLFRLLHPYYWPVSLLRWLADIVGVVSASVRATTSSLVRRMCAPVSRCTSRVTAPVRRFAASVRALPGRLRNRGRELEAGLRHVLAHPIDSAIAWWRRDRGHRGAVGSNRAAAGAAAAAGDSAAAAVGAASSESDTTPLLQAR